MAADIMMKIKCVLLPLSHGCVFIYICTRGEVHAIRMYYLVLTVNLFLAFAEYCIYEFLRFTTAVVKSKAISLTILGVFYPFK